MAKYTKNKIRQDVKELVKKACLSKDNKYKATAWSHHILPVVRISLQLGKKLKADLEVLELAALLHDYASIKDVNLAKEHHIYGARLAEEVLSPYGLSQKKIDNIKHAIFAHRGSQRIKRKTLEAKILASADAMSHFTELVDMLYLTFGVHQYHTVEGSLWLKKKLENSWRKIMPAGRCLIKKDKDIAFYLLNNSLKNKL